MTKAKSRAMETVQTVAKFKGKRLCDIGKLCGESRSMIYTRQETDDMKVEVLKKYLRVLGCDLVVQDRFSNTFWKI